MGKRSNFNRADRDFYPTPLKAVEPLIAKLRKGTSYYEPCAGDGALIKHLKSNGLMCVFACDIAPKNNTILKKDMFDINMTKKQIITNPPWDRKILHRLIEKIVAENAKAWLLFDADWMHTKQSARYMPYCSDIVSVGRVRWIENSKSTGKDNCAWYAFSSNCIGTNFTGRVSDDV